MPGLPGDATKPAEHSPVYCNSLQPSRHFPAAGATFLYSAQHSHRSPSHHPRRAGAQGAGIFRELSIWVLLSLERELGNPTAKSPQALWSQHFPYSQRVRSLLRFCAIPCRSL